MKQSIFLLLILTALACNVKVKQPKNWVSDFENVLSEQEEENLNFIIYTFEKETSNEIALITIEDIGTSASIKEKALEFGDAWGVGKKDKNNGLVILFSAHLKQTFLATGYGTEKHLTDEICKKIIEDSMLPHFKEGNYYLGLKTGLEECILQWK